MTLDSGGEEARLEVNRRDTSDTCSRLRQWPPCSHISQALQESLPWHAKCWPYVLFRHLVPSQHLLEISNKESLLFPFNKKLWSARLSCHRRSKLWHGFVALEVESLAPGRPGAAGQDNSKISGSSSFWLLCHALSYDHNPSRALILVINESKLPFSLLSVNRLTHSVPG